MEQHDHTFSIVILAAEHNPTILNPDFLVRNGIVPEEWPINSSKPILSTPGLSLVEYNCGISFSLDPVRLKILDKAPEGDSFPCPDIAIMYLEKIPHVNYRAIGINFEKALIFEKLEEARIFQKQTFLKDGPWDEDNSLSEFVAKFVYDLPDCQCNLQFGSPVELNPTAVDAPPYIGLILSANFHHDFSTIEDHTSRNAAMINSISTWQNDKAYFDSLTDKIIGGS